MVTLPAVEGELVNAHEGGWTITGNADQELTFTSPYGRTLRGRPPPLLPETRERIHHITGWDLGPEDTTT